MSTQRNILFGIGLVVVAFLLPSCKTYNLFDMTDKEAQLYSYDSIAHYKPNYQYTLRQDDKVSISVWGQDELSVGSSYGIYNSNWVYGKWLLVDAKGNIEVPGFGTMKVSGLTVIQLKNRLRDSLRQRLVSPVVDVKILNRKISVLGELRTPQEITLDKENNRLLDMVAKAGGFDDHANLKQIKVLRQVGPHLQVITINLTERGNYRFKNIPVYPGDVVIVPSRRYTKFDQRISAIIPFTSIITVTAIFLSAI